MSEDPALNPGSKTSKRRPLRHSLMGSPQDVRSAIHKLHVLGYAEVSAWSPPQPTKTSEEVISVLIQYPIH